MKNLFVTFICFVLFTISLFSQWTKANLTFSDFNFPSEVAAVNGYLFVGSSEGIIHRSSDEGNSWQIVINGLSASQINDFYTETAGGNSIIYVATDSGLFCSSNFGDEWQPLSNGITDKYLVSVYKTDNYLFTSSNYSKEYKSTDAGVNWEEISIGDNDQRVNTLIRLGNTIFAGLNGSGNHVYKSDDFGLTWSISDNGMANDVTTIEKLGTRLFASFYGLVYQSTDLGTNWINSIVGIPVGYPIPEMKSFGDYLFIATLAGIFSLHNSSTSVVNIGENITYPSGTSIDVNEEKIVLGVFNFPSNQYEVWVRPTSDITSTNESYNVIPSEIILEGNYPNPFNPTTKISWQSPISSHQTLKVYDVLGNEVATLVDEFREAGSYEITFSANELSSGVYFYKLQADSFVETKKMILLR